MSNSLRRAPTDVSALLAEVTLLAKESAPSYLRSDERADLAQDVAFECWRMMRRKTWRQPRSLRALVSRIVRLRATDQLRRQFSDQESLGQFERDQELFEAPPWMSPEFQAEDHDFAEHHRRLARRLPRKCREVYLLIRQDGESHQAVADLLGMSLMAVDQNLLRAQARMRIQLRALGIGPRM